MLILFVILGDDMKKINNKGFTLVELLGVIVVLLAIMLVAIPSIASTYEKNKQKIDKQKKQNIISAAEIYVSVHLKSDFDKYNNFWNGSCGIKLSELLHKNLITKNELKGSNGSDLYSDLDNTYVKYDTSSSEYDIITSSTSGC